MIKKTCDFARFLPFKLRIAKIHKRDRLLAAGAPVKRHPRYPLVLVHGFGFRDMDRRQACWGRIPDALRNQGADLYFGYTDAWGDYESNAALLKAAIEKILRDTGKEKVNIIAHSKGGIDSRYLIWKYDFGDKVASLTTIATPHHGSKIADLLYGADIIRTKPVTRAMKALGKLYGDRNPNLYQALAGLTTDHMKHFNEKITGDHRVYCQSVYAAMDSPRHDPLFFYTFSYIQGISGNNDGLVSEASALWDGQGRKLPGSLSHHDIIDMRKRPVRNIDVIPFYLNLVQDLAERGF